MQKLKDFIKLETEKKCNRGILNIDFASFLQSKKVSSHNLRFNMRYFKNNFKNCEVIFIISINISSLSSGLYWYLTSYLGLKRNFAIFNKNTIPITAIGTYA